MDNPIRLMDNPMNPKEFREYYGQSIQEVTMEVARAFYIRGSSLTEAFASAKAFVDYLREMQL